MIIYCICSFCIGVFLGMIIMGLAAAAGRHRDD